MMLVCTSPQDKRDSWDATFDNNEAYVSTLIECQIKLLLREAHLCISESMDESITSLLTITASGQREVEAKTNIGVGKLAFVPVSSYVNVQEGTSNNALSLGEVCVVQGKQLRAHIHPHHKLANAKDPKIQDVIAPFWLVQVTNNPDIANMGFQAYTLAAPGHDWHKGEYHIPIMRNTKSLKPGDVLFFFHKSGANVPKYPPIEEMKIKRMKRS